MTEISSLLPIGSCRSQGLIRRNRRSVLTGADSETGGEVLSQIHVCTETESDPQTLTILSRIVGGKVERRCLVAVSLGNIERRTRVDRIEVDCIKLIIGIRRDRICGGEEIPLITKAKIGDGTKICEPFGVVWRGPPFTLRRSHDIPFDLIPHLGLHDLGNIGNTDCLIGRGGCRRIHGCLLCGCRLQGELVCCLHLLGCRLSIGLGLFDEIPSILLGENATLDEAVDQIQCDIFGRSNRRWC